MILRSSLIVQEENLSPAPVPLTSKPLPEKMPMKDLNERFAALKPIRSVTPSVAFGGSRPRNCMITYDINSHMQPRNAYEQMKANAAKKRP